MIMIICLMLILYSIMKSGISGIKTFSYYKVQINIFVN